MNILAVDTSTSIASVAVLKNNQGLFLQKSEKQKSHSEVINNFIEQALTEAQLKLTDIDLFAVDIGPGSFTGIRVGTNAIKTLAYSFNKPVVAIDSLRVLAEQAFATSRDLPVLCIVNAHKNMVYTAIYRKKDNQVICSLEPQAIPVRDLKNHITERLFVVGDGWETYQEYFPEELKNLLLFDESFSQHHPLADSLAKIALQDGKLNKTMDWNSFTPLYIRSSEAEENRKGILLTPLK